MENVLRRPVRDPADGSVLHLLRSPLQRRFLQVVLCLQLGLVPVGRQIRPVSLLTSVLALRGAGAPPFLPFPPVHSLPHLLLSVLLCFTYLLLLSIPSLSARVVPLRFQAGGRRRQPNLGLVCYGRPM